MAKPDPKNADLWENLHNLEWNSLSDTERSDFVKACDALLAVDSNNPVAFRAVAKEHAKILELEDEKAAKEWATPASWNFLTTYDPNDYYKDSAFLDENDDVTFRSIQQEAAAQRVKLGLSAVSDVEILLGVMQNNTEELRKYLANHVVPTFNHLESWDPEAPSDKNILSDDILLDIQKEALAHWVLMTIDNLELDVLDRLIAKMDDDFAAEIKALPEFPDKHANLIEIDRIWNLVEKRVLARQKELLVQGFINEYNQFLKSGISDTDILDMESLLLEDDDADFIAGLPDSGTAFDTHKDDLSPEQVKVLREQLGERYLKVSVAHRIQNGESLDSLFDASTPEEFTRVLKKFYPAHDYIDHVVTPQFMKECKEQMAPQMRAKIAQEVRNKMLSETTPQQYQEDYKWLRDLATSKSDETFKNAIKASKSTASYVRANFPDIDISNKEGQNQALQKISDVVDNLFPADNRAQMDEVRQAARTRIFEMTISSALQLPIGSHKRLVEAFAKMSVEEQEKLLPRNTDDAERINHVRHIAMARDISVLKHYMPGAAEEDLQGILSSSQQMDAVQKIQNPGIRKALGARFPIALDSAQVKAINKALDRAVWDDASYVQMVAEIRTICAISEPGAVKAFNAAFGLAANGVTKSDPHGFIGEILNYNEKYQQLFKAYQDPANTINKEFLGMMLALPHAYGTIPNTPASFAALQKQVLNFADRELFINVCVGAGSTGLNEAQRNQFKASLERAITPAVFNEMQAALLQDACAEQKPEVAAKAVSNVQKILTQMQESQEKISKHLNSAQFVFDVQEIHINNLIIREQEKDPKPGESLREKYTALAKSCDVQMNELRHAHARLRSLIDALPNTDDIQDHNTKAQVGAKIEALKGKLQAQLDKIDEQLEQYAEIKERINGRGGILDMVQRIKEEPYWCYARAGISSGVKTREELKDLPIQRNAPDLDSDPNHVVIDSANDPGKVAKFNLENSLAGSQVRYFDMVHESNLPSDASKKVTIESRFTYDTSKSVTTTATHRGIHKENPGRITIDKFPDYQEGSPQDKDALEKAKVDYAMVVATQLLATMDRPPSKENPLRLRGANEEQLKYIWTALVVLGEKNPHMHFGPEAIKVVNEHIFNPKTQLGWGWSNFSKDSLYEKTFKKHSDSVTAAINDSKEHASERLNRKGTPKSEEQMKETSQLYRSTVNANRGQSTTQPVAAETEAEQARRAPPNTH
ncbi:AAA family ATPase [Legionella saoudiensis]|uniref:hypothetical protein n=1 Tax=Legionella saoudiensis TaxID=1750561 RepID=UPI00072FC9B1|nr:hypothetical protein [Legionella saoudiensis]